MKDTQDDLKDKEIEEVEEMAPEEGGETLIVLKEVAPMLRRNGCKKIFFIQQV